MHRSKTVRQFRAEHPPQPCRATEVQTMTKHDDISRIDDRFATLSYDELMLLV